MNAAEPLGRLAHQSPLRTALIERRGRQHVELTYAQLQEQVQQVATLLLQRGLQAGDSVLLLLPMSIPLYTTLLACFRIGVVAHLLDPVVERGFLEQCCTLARPKAFIAPARQHRLRLASAPLRAIPLKFHTRGWVPGSRTLRGSTHLHPSQELLQAEDATALVTYSQGRNGRPKATSRSHRFLLDQYRALAQAMGFRAGELDFTTQPVFVLANLHAGMTTLLPDADLGHPDPADADRICRQVMKYQPQRLSLSPGFLERLVGYCIGRHIQLSFPLHVYVGGGPVFPALMQRVHAIASRAEVTTLYGAVGAEPIAHITYEDMEQADLDAMTRGKGLLVGRPEPGLQLQIANESDDPTQAGEVLIRGGHIQPLGGANGDQPWYPTGDCGLLDEQGRLWLLGRCQSRLKDRHGVLFPLTVECAAMSHALVERAAFVASEGKRYLFIEGQHISSADIETLRYAMRWAQLEGIHLLHTPPLAPGQGGRPDYLALLRLVQKGLH